MPMRPQTHKPFPSTGATPHRPNGKRPSAHKRGYTRRWQQFRLWWLAQHPLCECGPSCCPDGCNLAATEVDHKRPVNGPDDPGFYDETNLSALAEACHSRKTGKDRRKGLCGNKGH